MSQSTRNKIKYNVVSQDEEKIKGDAFKSRSYLYTSETNPLDTFYKYYANRNDTNLFASGTNTETRTQVHDSVYTDYNKDQVNVVKLKESLTSFSYTQGYNTDEQKTYGYVNELLQRDPTQVITFTEQQSADLAAKTGMYIRNIKIYGSNVGLKNSYMPVTIIAPSDFNGYRSVLSSSGVTTAYDVTKIHNEGDIKSTLQGPFTTQHVGGYTHRHVAINTGSDNQFNRPELFSVSASGTSISFTSPLGSTPNYNKLAVRFSREGGARRVVNTKRIKTTDPRIAGNYSKNYEVFQATNRNENNLWFRAHPTASFPLIDSPYISGSQEFQVQDFTLGDGTNSEMIIAQTFGAPGGPETRAAQNLDPTSRQFSPYNTVNYRNPSARYYLNKKFLVDHAEYGNYTTAGYGLTASFHGIQRNTNYNITSSGGIVKKYDNAFIRREIPASPRGYSWINSRFGTGSFDNNVFVKDYSNPGITFLSKSLDRSVYFETYGFNTTQDEMVKSSSFSAYSTTFTANSATSLNTYLISRNKLMGFGTQRQLSNYYNPIRLKTRKRVSSVVSGIGYSGADLEIIKSNYVGNIDDKKQFVYYQQSPINSKYRNIVVEYNLSDGNKENISLPFASNYSYLGDFYNISLDRLDTLYKDERNIRYADKSGSLFYKLLEVDKEKIQNNITNSKINKIYYKEKLWPKTENSYRNIATGRSLLSVLYTWNSNFNNRSRASTQIFGWDPGQNSSAGQLNYPASGKEYASVWPMDTYTYQSGTVFIEKSGVLMHLDNPTFVSNSYAGINFTGSYLFPPYGTEMLGTCLFGRNFNTNRPQNTIQDSVSVPYYDSYKTVAYDVKYNFKNYAVFSSYNPTVVLGNYYNEGTTPPVNYEYVDSYNLIVSLSTEYDPLGFSVDYSTGQITLNQFYSDRLNYTDFIDVLPDFNKNEDLKISKIKFNLNTVKKFVPLSEFYPSEQLSKVLPKNFYKYFIKNGGSITDAATGAFIFSGSWGGGYYWAKPALQPLFYPGITFNSIKSGIAMPFNVITTDLSTTGANVITGNLNGDYYTKIPFEAALDPSKFADIKIYDADPDIQFANSASATLQKGFQKDSAYKELANNLYSEIVEFFIKDEKLPSLSSTPEQFWYFPDLTKDYSMRLVINKTPNFTTYSSLENFGPRPYIFHNPPWITTSEDATLQTITGSSFNSDLNLAPSSSWKNASYAAATITFKPSLITASAGVQIVAGKGAQFTFNEIKRYSTVTYESSFVTSSTVANKAVNLGDCVEIFGFSETNKTWTPYVKWTNPTANLNFSGTMAKLTNSSGYDSGGTTPGDAIRGVWHQLGVDVNDTTGLFFQATDNSNTLTGSLLDIVGFNPKERIRIGEVATSKTFEEALVIVPVYLENEIEEKLLYLNLDKFEKNYGKDQDLIKMDNFSKKYIMPPLMDFMRIRRNSKIPLKLQDYGKVSAPFLFFFEEFKSVITRSDLIKIWQGIMPDIAKTMEMDNKTIEFDLKNSNIFSYDDLVKFGNTLPKNLRFKVFKVSYRAETDYKNVINRTLNDPINDSYKLAYNWPYSKAELIAGGEVEVELEYDKTNNVAKGFHLDNQGNVVKDSETNK